MVLHHSLYLGVPPRRVDNHRGQDSSRKPAVSIPDPLGVGGLHDANHRRLNPRGIEPGQQVLRYLNGGAVTDILKQVPQRAAAFAIQER